MSTQTENIEKLLNNLNLGTSKEEAGTYIMQVLADLEARLAAAEAAIVVLQGG